MTFEEFKASVQGTGEAPQGLSDALLALWCDGRGDWDGAHQSAQDDKSRDGSWVHAYLHRKEGDLGNSGYWYSRAGRKIPTGPLKDEWNQIARELLDARSQAKS